MALTVGTRIGAYEVSAAIGAGGMGEVYRARDTKLDRDVAIKVLPEALASDPERIARFEREAKTLASLNHPNIAHIHGLEESGGVRALVMELVEGPTLADRIAQGPIPIDESLPIARQIAEALEAAHEQGIIHRDLKPANVKVRPDGTVKVLDFGLAKALEAPAASSPSLTQSPTITTPAMMTGVGVILGTAAYMSPEQAKGRPADKRSDIWAFGCVLYEMLTGKRAFDGEDISDTLAAILRGEPDWAALPSSVPQSLRDLIKQCLEKDRRRRVAEIAVAQYVMNERPAAFNPAHATVAPSTPRSRQRILGASAAGLVAALILVTATAWIVTRWSVPTVPPVTRFTIVPPAGQPLSLVGADRDFAIAPDGTFVVYRALSSQPQLMVRFMNELEARPLAGTENGRWPFISPDGRWVGFFAFDFQVKKVSITGGPPIPLCRYVGAPRGASWGPDDSIVFATSDRATGLLSVRAGGGDPIVLTKPAPATGEDHQFPFVLPSGRAVLFTILVGLPENAQIAVLDLTTGQHTTVIRGGSHAEYVAPSTGQPGYLVYSASGSLRTVRFDPVRLQVLSDPVATVDQVMSFGTGAAEFATSRTGALVFVPSTAGGVVTGTRSLVWVNRQGREEPIKAEPRAYMTARLSPDGTRVALDVNDRDNDVWIWDLARQTLDRLTTSSGTDMSPVWTPDSRSIIWAGTTNEAVPNLYRQAADGTGKPDRLTTSPSAQFPSSISQDARLVLWESAASVTNYDISTLDLRAGATQPHRTEPLIHTAANESNGELSPDEHWIAYQSNESGQFEIYVSPFPKVDESRAHISTAGGTRPLWARNGRELFYLDAKGLLTAVPIPVQSSDTTFKAGVPTKLLDTRYFAGSSSRGLDLRGYDVSLDGQRFLMIKDNTAGDRPSAPPASMELVLNWVEELKQRVGK